LGLRNYFENIFTDDTFIQGMGLSDDNNMPQAFPQLVRKILPTASDEVIQSIQAQFPYPPTQPERLAWDWTTAIIFECNAYFVTSAYREYARRYIMTIPPATHAQDVNCELSLLSSLVT
jgi:hypothetical protein